MARLAISHPSRKRLIAWLDHPDASESQSVTTHVERCDRCADRLEELSADVSGEDDRLDPQLSAALREVFEPPAGISERVMRSIDERERADRELNLFLGLFAIPSDAASLMLPDESAEPREDRPERED